MVQLGMVLSVAERALKMNLHGLKKKKKELTRAYRKEKNKPKGELDPKLLRRLYTGIKNTLRKIKEKRLTQPKKKGRKNGK